MHNTETTFANAIFEAADQAMARDTNVIYYGLGVDDPTGVFGTTKDLHRKYGSVRVFDTPTSENALLGVGIGAAINGLRPIMVCQRLDFFLLAMDQLVNNAAKWRFMFGGKGSIPLVVRLIIGRGWGQGPTHSQSLQSWFAHIPGLKVVMPSTTFDAKRLMCAAINDDNPVVFLEHRWLHNQLGDVQAGFDAAAKITGNTRVREGRHVTVVANSYLLFEAIRALDFLFEYYDISCDLIDLNVLSPLDVSAIVDSVATTGRLLVLDNAHSICSLASEVIAQVVKQSFAQLKQAPVAVTKPDYPEPTSYALTERYYCDAYAIANKIGEMLAIEVNPDRIKRKGHHDVPGDWFTGPF